MTTGQERSEAAVPPFCPTCASGSCLVRRRFERFFDAPLAAEFETVTAPRGHRVELAGDSGAELSVVTDGMVMLESSLPDGRRQVSGFCTAGEVLAPAALCEPLACDMTAIAPTRVCQVRPAGGSNGRGPNGGRLPARLTKSLLDAAFTRLASTERHLLLLSRLAARERVASFLLEMAARIGCRSAAGLRVELPMSREVIADYLGLNAETVSRQFTRLKRLGAIDLPRPGLVLIADRRRLAAETPLSRFTVPRLSADSTAEPAELARTAP